MKKIFTLNLIGWSALSIILIAATFMTIAQPYRMSGDCMEPAVKNGSLWFLNKISPYFCSYKIDDIIAFNHEEKLWYSRIVALENDTIQLNEGSIIVNGTALQEANIKRDWADWKYGTYAIESPLKIPTGHVYVLSDKLSAHHDDSRVFGPIAISSILGTFW